MTTHRQDFATQSAVTDPGRLAAALDAVPADVARIRQVSSGLVFHYRVGGDWAACGVAPDRIREIDIRYVDLMLDLLLALRPGLATPRIEAERLVGCCRDATVLFLAMARHRGIPARARVGFAAYFTAGWWVDHTVAEVWDAAQGRWRLVEPQVAVGHVDPTDGEPLDVLDVDRARFRTGPDAWRACRSGAADPERFVVDPGLDLPALRSWPYLAHNLVLDLAALGRRELVLWDDYGALDGGPGSAPATLLDDLAAATVDPDVPPAEVARWLARDELTIPPTIRSFSPARDGAPADVTLRPWT